MVIRFACCCFNEKGARLQFTTVTIFSAFSNSSQARAFLFHVFPLFFLQPKKCLARFFLPTQFKFCPVSGKYSFYTHTRTHFQRDILRTQNFCFCTWKYLKIETLTRALSRARKTIFKKSYLTLFEKPSLTLFENFCSFVFCFGGIIPVSFFVSGNIAL